MPPHLPLDMYAAADPQSMRLTRCGFVDGVFLAFIITNPKLASFFAVVMIYAAAALCLTTAIPYNSMENLNIISLTRT